MPTLEQEAELRKNLLVSLDELGGMSPQSLARTDLGAGLNFEQGVIFFSRTLDLFRALRNLSLDELPHDKLTKLINITNSTLNIFREIKNFSLQKHPNNPIQVRDGFINQARDGYDRVFSDLSPIISFGIRTGIDFSKLEEQARVVLQRIEELSDEHKKSMEAAKSDADELLTGFRKIAKEAGVSQEAVHFNDEASTHETAAKIWLWVTASFALGSAAVGVIFLFLFADNVATWTTGQNLQMAISKIIVLSILFSATLWAGKTYRAHRHNVVINRHRANALATFKAFVEATKDEPTKNAVLLQATQCIFSPQQSGYVAKGESDTSGTTQVLEIIRTLGKGS